MEEEVTTRKKAEEVKDEETADDADEAVETDSGGDASSDGLADRIVTIVKETVRDLMGSGEVGNKSTSADDEGRVERLVRDAQRKLKAEDEKEGKLKNLEETLQKITERPPARSGIGGKLQRFFWGEE